MTDFTIFFKERLNEASMQSLHWDVFVSAYQPNERVTRTFGTVNAETKLWIGLPEYGYDDLPPHTVILDPCDEDPPFEVGIFDKISSCIPSASASVCVDITGFLNNYVVYLVRWLQQMNFTNVNVIYTEPSMYSGREGTKFSDEQVVKISQIAGFEGFHEPTRTDLLVIAAGYDHQLITEVATHKDNARKIAVLGFPALSPDMFQQSLLRISESREALGAAITTDSLRFAPASDPFVLAETVKDIVASHRDRFPGSNVYLCPLSTKAHALGMALYYAYDAEDTATSVIHPHCDTYEKNSSVGVGGVWLYTIELP